MGTVKTECIEDLADFCSKFYVIIQKKGIPLGVAMNIIGIIAFHQFNGTRNDTEILFRQIIKDMEKE